MKFKNLLLLIAFFLLFSRLSLFAQYGQGYAEKGVISYFTEKFDNRKTASGEIFDNSKLVGSHKKIPFNSMVKVTNLSNGKAVIVRVNDRGPYAYGRIMDISEAAAKKIDLIATGTAKVELEVVGNDYEITVKNKIKKDASPEKIVSASNEAEHLIGNTYSRWGTSQKPEGYGIQVAKFLSLERAKSFCKLLADKGLNEKIFIQVGLTKDKTAKDFRVLVGEFTDKSQSDYLKTLVLSTTGFSGFLQSHFK